MKRLYGKIHLKDKRWHLTGDPHVLLLLKRVFGRIWAGEHGTVTFQDSDEMRRKIQWFLILYPMNVSPEDKKLLADGSHRHDETILRLDELIDTKHVSRAYKMALPPRDYQKVAAEMALDLKGLLIADDLGTGKAQPVDANVLTPSGWRPIGSLAIGDVIIDPDGGSASVSGVFPQGVKGIYRVTARDGLSAECCEDHLWLLHTPNDRRRGTYRVLPLKDFMGDLRRSYGKKGDVHLHWYFLPVTQPVEFRPVPELPVNPYLLGALLGDGTFKKAGLLISKSDKQFIDKVRDCLPKGMAMHHVEGPDWRISRLGKTGTNPLLNLIRELGLSGKKSYEKFIPKPYLSASIPDRKLLLAGLMDSDGTAEKQGAISYSSSSSQLAAEVRELVMSLGGFATLTSRIPTYTYKGKALKGRRSYNLFIQLPFNPFLLTRKAARCRTSLMCRAVDKIEYVGTKQAVCISTTSKRKLYVTDNYLVTHNTISALAMLTDKATLPAVVVTLSGTMPFQWRDQTWKFLPELHTHIVKKGTPYPLPKVNGRGPDLVIINYHKLSGWSETLGAYAKCVIFDEVQELRRTGSLKYSAAENLAQQMKYKCGLSATPIFNLGGEMWNVINILKPDALGTWDEFLREWCYGENENGRKAPAVKDPKALGSYLKTEHLMLRRTRKEVGRELPALTKIIQPVESDEKAFDEIEDKAAELARIILSSEKIGNWERMRAHEEFDNKMRQATGISKAPYVADFIRLLVEADDEPVLVFGWHRAVYDILLSKLKDLEPEMFTGSETAAHKAAALKKFMDGKTKILLMSLRAGQGLDGIQHHCRTVVFGELDWSPAVMDQDVGRVLRDGQPDPVTVFYLVSESGSDPIIAETLGLKQAQLEGIRDPERGIIAELQTDKNRIRDLARHYLDRSEKKVRTKA